MRPLAALIAGVALLLGVSLPAPANVMVVNRDSGRIQWLNYTASPVVVAAYTLQSASGGFEPDNWLSIAENYDADSGGAVDPVHTWFELGRDAFNLSEATFGAASIPAGAAIDLGNAWRPGHVEDLTFEYLDAAVNSVLGGNVFFINTLAGDYNGNGFVEQGDLDLVLLNWGRPAVPSPQGWLSDLPSGIIDQSELDRVLLNWGTIGPVAALQGGAVVPLVAVNVPESSSASLCAILAILGNWLIWKHRR